MFERRSIPLKRQTGASTLTDLDDVTITSVADGDFLQYNGSAWVNTGDVYVKTGQGLRVYDATDTDYFEITESGSAVVLDANNNNVQLQIPTDKVFTIAEEGTAKVQVDHLNNYVWVRDGYALRVSDSTDTDYVDISHNGTDLDQTYTTTTDHNFWGLTGAFKFKNAAQNDIFMVDFANSLIDIHDGYALRLRDSTDADWVSISHDGTDVIVNEASINPGWLQIQEFDGVYITQDGKAAKLICARGTTANPTDAAEIQLLETQVAGGEFGATSVFGMRLKYDGNSNVFTIAGGNQTTTTTHLTMNRDTGDTQLGGTLSIDGDTTGMFESVTGSYGSVQVTGAEGGSGTWGGYSIEGRHVFMNNGSAGTRCGIYDDVNNSWIIEFNQDGNREMSLYYAGGRGTRTRSNTNGSLEVYNTLTGAGWERVLTESDAGGLDTKVKTATTSRSSTTTFSADPHLAGWTLTAGQKYGMIGHLTYIAANTTPDIKFDWVWTNAPADAGDWGLLQTDDAKVLQEADSESPMTTAMVALDIASREQTAWIHGHFEANASTGGTVSLHWAQNTSSATSTQLLLGSWIALIDLGA